MGDAMANASQKAKHIGTSKILMSAYDFRRWGRKSPFLRYGLPLISVCVFGTFGLAHMIKGSKDIVKEKDDLEWEILENTRALSRTDTKKSQEPKKNFSLDEELKVLQEKVDIHNFEYKEIPRPTAGQSNKN